MQVSSMQKRQERTTLRTPKPQGLVLAASTESHHHNYYQRPVVRGPDMIGLMSLALRWPPKHFAVICQSATLEKERNTGLCFE
jgi:hypothetical protein